MDAPIVAVTVYPDRARVARLGSINLPAGRQRVLVEPLPLALEADSIRVGGRGPATVLGVDVTQRTLPRTPDTLAARLQEKRRRLAASIAELKDAIEVQRQHAGFLTELGKRSSGTYARALAAGDSDPEAVAAFAGALVSQLADVNARKRELAERQFVVEEDLAAVDRELSAMSSQLIPDRLTAAIDLDVSGDGGEVRLELSYVIPGAGWSSSYDLRVDGERLALTWYGLISQRTGEDWPECDLFLSTARPSGTATVPELEPWYLDIYRPPVIARGAPPPMSAYGMQYGAPAMAAPGAAPGSPPAATGAVGFGDLFAEVEVPAPIEETTTTIEQGISAATYRSARPVAVPSDGGSHRATVAVVDLHAVLDYVVAPVKAPEAHLRATVVNGSEHTLLPGPAAVFTGGDFVGTTALETWAPGEEIELALGVDDRIRVDRELVGRRASKAALLGGTRRREAEYRTRVANHTPAQARITVLDQLPVSKDESITVKDLRIQPAPAERTDLGVLTWRLTLAPGESTEILLGLRVDQLRGVLVVGWRE